MKNFIQPGHSLDLLAPAGGVVAGNAFVIGSLVGVANTSAAATKSFTGSMSGVYAMNKVSTQAWTAGAKIYWDDTAKLATTVSSANTLLGTCVEAAANPSATGKVRLGATTV